MIPTQRSEPVPMPGKLPCLERKSAATTDDVGETRHGRGDASQRSCRPVDCEACGRSCRVAPVF